jgi:hypothetical protein
MVSVNLPIAINFFTLLSEGELMASISPCTLQKHLKIIPGNHADYKQLSKFHYRGTALGPTRFVYTLIDDHLWRRLAAPVVGVIVYGSPSANLAGRTAATGGVLGGLDRAAGFAAQ